MRLIVRQLSEGAFFRSPDIWVKSAEQATEVDCLESALECLNGRDLSGLELVVLSDAGHPGLGFGISDLANKRPRRTTAWAANIHPPAIKSRHENSKTSPVIVGHI